MRSQETSNWKGRVIIIIGVTAVLAVAGWYGYQYMESMLAGTKKENAAEKQYKQPPSVKEQQGVAPESVTKEDANTAKENIALVVQKIFTERNDKDVADITVAVDQFTEKYSRGSSTVGPMGDAADAVWFAIMSDGKWKMAVHVASHDGEYYCDHIKQYNFPPEFTGDCIKATPFAAKDKELFGLVQFVKSKSYYEWEVKYDKSLLKLEKRTSVPWDSARPGEGANETFTFTPFKKGETALVFSLKKTEQDAGPLDEQHYAITIQ